MGAAWVFTRTGGVWTQQGNKLVGGGAVGAPQQGWSVALSADGNTAIVGGPTDDSISHDGGIGAAWVFTRSGGAWTQQGNKLGGTDVVYAPFPNTQGVYQGLSVALSADGNTAIVGGPGDNTFIGAAWVYTRSGGVWAQQGNKLVGTGATMNEAQQGSSVALSGDGNTAIVGGPGDGAAWVYTRSGGVWTQQGNKLVGTGAGAVSLSFDGNTAIVGDPGDNNGIGAAWVFTRSGGVWTQQGNELVGSGAVGPLVSQGYSVSLSSDGNTAIVGGPQDNSNAGAAWVYTRSGGVWTQQGSKLVGTGAVGAPYLGNSVALSGDGNTAMVGGLNDNVRIGAAWVFVQPGLQVAPATDIVAAGNPGGPFAPSSFQYQLSATTTGSFNYSISGIPNWLTPSSTSGTVSTTGMALTFTVNVNANTLPVGTYGPTTTTFANSDTGQATTTITATLTINPRRCRSPPRPTLSLRGSRAGHSRRHRFATNSVPRTAA
jgi:lipocalin